MSESNNLGHILLVDDERHITELLKYNLESESYAVTVTDTAARAMESDLSDYRLIIIDAMNQRPDGRELLRHIKADPLTAHIPVIMVAHSDSEDAILGAFDDGADDYIVKPFSIRELVARVRSVMRRHPRVTRSADRSGHIAVGNLDVDLINRRVNDSAGEVLPLTRTEFAIFALLAKNRDAYYNRRQIYTEVWGMSDSTQNDRAVDTNISRLRKKLTGTGVQVVNKSDLGYALVV